MGQTLPNDIYLPAEGERNCYDGLEGNWRSLDSLISTVAGKASATHTHGNITNDGKLTSGNRAVITGSDKTITESSVTDTELGYVAGVTSAIQTQLNAKAADNDVVHKTGNENIAGDKSFTGSTLSPVLLLNKNQAVDITQSSYQSAINNGELVYRDSSNETWAGIEQVINTDARSILRLYVRNKNTLGAADTTAIELCKTKDLQTTYLAPWANASAQLGTSTNKWKSLNGINPGALSLPNVNAVTGSSNTQLQDISGDLVQDQYFNCYFTPRMDGWAYIALNCSNATIRSGHSSYTVSVKTARSFANALYTQPFTKNENAWSQLVILFPVTANKEITLELTFTGFSVIKAYVIPAQGNV